MTRFLSLLFFVIILVSCNDKIVQLPETDSKNITEMQDISAAYIFYDETKKDSVEFNQKNLISTTNWLVNVDKRLTLKQVIPYVIYLQEKRQKAGKHKNEIAENYFTCSNPEIQNLAFIEFTDIVYHLKPFTNLFNDKKPLLLGYIDIVSLDQIILGIASEGSTYQEETDVKKLLEKLIEFNTENELFIIVSFHSNLNFQDYITVKSLLLKFESDYIKISKDEFIYN